MQFTTAHDLLKFLVDQRREIDDGIDSYIASLKNGDNVLPWAPLKKLAHDRYFDAMCRWIPAAITNGRSDMEIFNAARSTLREVVEFRSQYMTSRSSSPLANLAEDVETEMCARVLRLIPDKV